METVTADTATVTASDLEIVRIPLAQIFVPNDWNVRSFAAVTATTDEKDETTGLAGSFKDENNQTQEGGLVESIRLRGQDTPVDIRPNPKHEEDPSEPRWVLVSGFRRYEAIKRLAATGRVMQGDPLGWSPVEPTIKARIHLNMDEAGARELNLRENLARKNLSHADIAFGISEMKRANKELTDTKIAQLFNLTQSYVSKLRRIVDFTAPEVTNEWRRTPKAVPVDDMLKLRDKPIAEQYDAFKKMIGTAPKPSPEERKASAAESRRKTLSEKSGDVGTLIARLHKKEFEVSDPNFYDTIAIFLSFMGSKVDEKEDEDLLRACADAALKGFEVAMSRSDAPAATPAETPAATPAETPAEASPAPAASSGKRGKKAN